MLIQGRFSGGLRAVSPAELAPGTAAIAPHLDGARDLRKPLLTRSLPRELAPSGHADLEWDP